MGWSGTEGKIEDTMASCVAKYIRASVIQCIIS